jgi:hypothetical protein
LKRFLCWLVFLGIFASASVAAQEAASEKFERARLEFSYKNFENAARLLEELLRPEVQLAGEEEIVSAREMLGLCYFYLDRREEARREFVALLRFRPWHRLDPFLIPPPAVAFFEGVRSEPELAEELGRLMAGKKPPEEKVKVLRIEREVYLHPRWLMFLPFGAGQFENQQKLKGALFATGQGLGLVGNIVCYSLLIGLANENGRYRAEDLTLARGLQVGQYVSLGLFVLLWAAGALDANLNYSPQTPGAWREFSGAELMPGPAGGEGR